MPFPFTPWAIAKQNRAWENQKTYLLGLLAQRQLPSEDIDKQHADLLALAEKGGRETTSTALTWLHVITACVTNNWECEEILAADWDGLALMAGHGPIIAD